MRIYMGGSEVLYYQNQDNAAISVSAVNAYIKTLFENSDILNGICVRGEISNFKAHSSGHYYFSLKDEGGSIRAVMFASAASKLKLKLQNGMKVLAYGSVSVYIRDGQYQLYVMSIVPDGIGALYQAFEELKNRLAKEGLFAPELKKPIPKYPQKIGIVTSATGAAVHDMMQVIGRRFPPAEIYVRPAEVQGIYAPESLIAGLRFFETEFPVDVIIIGRGGGSMEDLWAFNDEALAYCIASCMTPIISAVGHEIDFTICDFVADLRAPTPSAAAELVVPDAIELKQMLKQMESNVMRALLRKIEYHKNEIAHIATHPIYTKPTVLLRDYWLELDGLSTKAERRIAEITSELGAKIDAFEVRVEALNPQKVLKRGYSIVTDQNGQTITRSEHLSSSDKIRIVFADGHADATVQTVSKA